MTQPPTAAAPAAAESMDSMGGLSAELSAPAALAAEHRRQRARRLKLAILSAVLVKPMAVVITLVTVPLFLGYLGTERYGLYEAVAALAVWLGLTQAGLSMSLVNRLIDCDVAGDRERARSYVSTLVLTLGALVVVIAALWAGAVSLVDWQQVFPARGALARSETPRLVLVAGWIALGGILGGLAAAVYTAYQEQHRSNLWDGVAKLATLLACLLVVRTPLGVVGVALAIGLTPTLVRIGNAAVLFLWEKPWLRPSVHYFDSRLLRGLLSQGIGLFVLQVSYFALYQTDKLIIGSFLEPRAVTGYAVLGQLFLMAYGVLVLVLAPLWPAHGEAMRRGDTAWVRLNLNRTLVLGCGVMSAFGLVMLVWGAEIIRFWTRGQPVEISGSLVAAMTAAFVVKAWVDCPSTLLKSIGVIKPQILLYGGHAILNLVLSILLARPYGVEGVAWATSISGLVTGVWGYPWLVRRHLGRP